MTKEERALVIRQCKEAIRDALDNDWPTFEDRERLKQLLEADAIDRELNPESCFDGTEHWPQPWRDDFRKQNVLLAESGEEPLSPAEFLQCRYDDSVGDEQPWLDDSREALVQEVIRLTSLHARTDDHYHRAYGVTNSLIAACRKLVGWKP